MQRGAEQREGRAAEKEKGGRGREEGGGGGEGLSKQVGLLGGVGVVGVLECWSVGLWTVGLW